MTVFFEWQQIDKGSQENPEIRLTGVPEGTKRFLVSLVDLNLKGFDHGSGYNLSRLIINLTKESLSRCSQTCNAWRFSTS